MSKSHNHHISEVEPREQSPKLPPFSRRLGELFLDGRDTARSKRFVFVSLACFGASQQRADRVGQGRFGELVKPPSQLRIAVQFFFKSRCVSSVDEEKLLNR